MRREHLRHRWSVLPLFVAMIVGNALAETPAAAWDRLISQAHAARLESRLEVAERLLAEALNVADTFGEQDPRRLSSLEQLGELYREDGRYAEAAELLRQRVSVMERTLSRADLTLIHEFRRLGYTFDSAGDHQQARRIWQRLIDDATEVFGEDSLQAGEARADLAHSYQMTENYYQASILYATALKKMPRDSRSLMIIVLSRYATVLRHLGQDSEAGEHEREAAQLRDQLLRQPPQFDVEQPDE